MPFNTARVIEGLLLQRYFKINILKKSLTEIYPEAEMVCSDTNDPVVFEQEVPISIWSVIISVSVGIISGLMPAIKAMKLDPIDALRFQ